MKQVAAILHFENNKIPSVNALYENTRYGGRRLSDLANRLKPSLKSQLESQFGDKPFSGFQDPVITLQLSFVFDFRFWSRDATNCVKFIEDIVKEVIDVDDNNNVKVIAEKVNNDMDDKEYAIVAVEAEESTTYPWKLSQRSNLNASSG